MKTKKILVYTLILLLSISFTGALFAPAKAETTWTNITLPYTITESGNYAISDSWTGTGIGLNISASDVVVDGQNNSISLPSHNAGDIGVYIESQSYITLQNLNVVSSSIGLQVNSSSSFTIQNCNITNGFDDGLSIVNCTDFTVQDSNIVKSYNGIDLHCSSSFQIFNCNASANLWFGILANTSSEFYIYSCNASANTIDNGFYAENCDSFTVDTVDLSYNGWNGFSVYASSNYSFENSNSSYNTMEGVYTGYGNNSYVENCIIDGNGDIGIMAPFLIDGYYDTNEIANNSQAGLAYFSDNISFDDNNIKNNGLTAGTFYGGIQATDSNCTVTGNNFDSNYDALLWEATDTTSNNNFNVFGNLFQNNDYTMFFNYTLPSSNSNQKLCFYNNFVNDSALVDPTCLTADYSGNYLPLNSNIFNLNTTVQFGARAYSNGPFIGGNFWATPDGTGFSQIGTDADQDGFVDSAFNLFNNASIGSAYDYHPYSLNFDVNTWVNITLPATITSPGHYRISSPYTGRGIALTIAANNVTIDGQNNQIQNSLIRPIQSDITPQIPSGTGVTIRDSENVTLENFNIQNETIGIEALDSSFTIRNCNFTGNYEYGIMAQDCYNCNVQGCNFTENNEGVGGDSWVNTTISRCYFNNNTEGIDMMDCNNCTYTNSMFNNCSSFALWDIYSANETISGNCFDHTGTPDSNDWEGTALFLGDVDCKVSDNIFLNNYNGFFWGVSEPEFNFTQLVYNNQFIDNNNTMILCCFEPNTYANEKMCFYNNFVNDTNYVNPCSFSDDNSGPNLPFNNSILIFNVPIQTGNRVYSDGGMIGGNYWAHPNGTGPSQTGADANHDGFIDTPFELFDNATNGIAYDYLPYSSNYIASLICSAGAQQTIAVNQTSSISVQLVDFFGNPTYGAIVNLTSTSSAGKFYSDAAATQQITSIAIPVGSSTICFYYKDFALGTSVITASAQGVTNNATATITVTPAALDHFTVQMPTYATAGSPITVQVTAKDAYGNTVTSFTGTVALSGANIAPATSGNFTNGTWTGSVTLTAAIIIQITASDGNGHSGISNGITVTGATTPTQTSTVTPTPTPTTTPTPIPTTTSTIQATQDDGSTVNLPINGNIAASQYSNVTITTNQTATTTIVSFTVTGQSGSAGYCNITIPKGEIPYGTTVTVYIDGQPAQDQSYSQDANNYYVWYALHFSTHNVELRFVGEKNPTYELPTLYYGLIVAAIVIVVIAAAVVVDKSKRKPVHQ